MRAPSHPLRTHAWRWATASVFCCIYGSAFAQLSGANVPLDRQVDEAFKELTRAPSDAASNMRYARLLVQAGNYEGGVAALESMLINPDAPPSIRLELAVLYYRMGSYAMSEALLRAALEDGRLADEHRAQAITLLRDVTARNQPSQLSGFVMLSLRTQTNPNARSDRDMIYANGALVPQGDRFKPDSDSDVQLTARLDHRHDLDLQNEASVVSSLVAQVVDYRSSSGSKLRADQTDPYDLALLEITSGIRFKPAPIQLPELRVRPHLIAAELLAQQHRYLSNAGVGLDVEYRWDERTLAEATYEYRHYDYASRIDVPDAKLLGGPDNGLRLRLTRELAPGQALSAEIALRDHDTSRSHYDYSSRDLQLTYFIAHANPLSSTSGNWLTSLWTGASQREYGAGDPAINADRARKDNEFRVGASLTVPMDDKWSLQWRLEHLRTNSNLPNYDNKNTSLQASVVYVF